MQDVFGGIVMSYGTKSSSIAIFQIDVRPVVRIRDHLNFMK
jgi:hypothetical protein